MKVDIFNTENKYKIIYADPAWLYRDIQAGLVTSVEELEKDLLQLLKKNILQSIELSWMREPEREQRLRGLSR